MVTTFNTKDMVQFGNWMMQRVKDGKKESDPSGDFQVTDADIQNWKFHKSKNMTVRAKFLCHQIQTDDPEQVNVVMTAVATGSPENEEFSKYTPGGNLNIMIDREADAVNLFNEGSEYFLDFTLAPI